MTESEKIKPNPKHIGEVSELSVTAELLKLEFKIFKPIVSERCDLLIEKDKKYLKLQIKTARIQKKNINNFSFATRSSYFRKGKWVHKSYSEQDIDYFVVWLEELKEAYIISVNEVKKGEMCMRFKNFEKIFKATDSRKYLLKNFKSE